MGQAPDPGCGQTFCVRGPCVVVGNQVAGDLQSHKRVVGQVPVERIDDPVSVGCDGKRPVVICGAGGIVFGITHVVEPVTRPANTKVRGSE
ncbi:MAG: hypothetical protein CMJ70_17145 [Planctomycetaceae bacterium]|nr:hypothetical protein [Planctomycetaceae bacterium]HAA70532.1 hypothetical protein [Planctomycetaceae bacterium]